MDEVFRALADPTRRAILDELTTRDNQTLFELCSRLTNLHGVSGSRQATTQHLDVLAAAGLIEVRREGRTRVHSIRTQPLVGLTDRWLQPDPAEE